MADESPSLPPGIRLVPVDFDPFAGETPALLPLTEAQREIWASIQAGGADASSAYNLCYAVQIRGRLDLNLLRRAFRALIARHEAFRLSFMPDGPEQKIETEPIEPEVRYLDLSGLSAGEREAQTADLVRAESRTPFDLGSAPLLRACVARLEPDLQLLVMTVHHIVCDGWSASALLVDLGTLYEAQVGGRSPKLAVTQSFGDYVRWQQGPEWQAIHAASEAYWLARLRKPPTLDLPTDRARPRLRTHRGGQERLAIDAGLARRLRRVGGRYGCTPYILFLAAYQVLLHRLSGQDDIVVGTAVAGQTVKGWENMVGHAVSVLPLRSRLDLDAPFSRHLAETKQTVLDAQEHQAVTFGTVVPKLKLSRDPSRIPLVPVVFNLDRVFGAPRFADLAVQSFPVPKSFVTFELGLNVVDYGSGIIVEADYNTDLFDSVTILRWLEHLHTLLGAVAEAPERPVTELPLLSEAETRMLAAPPAARHPGAACLHERFEAEVGRSPERIAVVCDGETLTYRQLNGRANRLARALRDAGVGPDVSVGLCVERSLDMVVAILATLKAGGAYVPLDPSYPAERLGFMVEDAGIQVLLAQEHLLPALPPHKAKVLDIGAVAGRESSSAADEENLPSEATPDNLAYVIYTSGSTGQPKGVLISHRNVLRLMEATDPWFGFRPDDVWTLFHSYAFDFSVWEFWGALLYGGRLIVVPYWVSRSPEAFLDLLEREQVTVLNQTPSAFQQLVPAVLESQRPRQLALRYVIFGGEALELQGLRPWFERFGDTAPRLINMYGITETTVHVTYRPIRMADVEAGTGSVIGIPIPDLSVYLLDQRGKLVPVGVAGEMYVGGGGLARGYLDRPDLTAERFVPNPFAPGERLYRSGDLARRLPDGDLEYLGRIDHQVKIRGFRIELGEIEAVLAQHAEVQDAVVLAREDVPGDKRLAAYVVRREGGVTVSDLRQHVRTRLPEYMVPTAWEVLDRLPLTSNGKVDREALPVPEADARSSALHAAPSTDTEVWVAALWAEILHTERVGREDDFFALGGHSLLATVVATRVREFFGVSLSVRAVFEASTVAQLAECIDTLRWTVNGRSGELSATKVGREEMTL